MNAIHISGGVPLQGEVEIQGSKNAVLPILAATILIKGSCVIRNCPQIADVICMMKLLRSVGCEVLWRGRDIIVNALHIYENRLPKEHVTKMRSSVILMGALLARTGEVQIDYPGGCVIGDRPLDIHMEALRQLGVQIQEKGNTIYASVTQLQGNSIKLRFPSVGATQNSILAAVIAEGITLIENSAREPEITALCSFLKKAGAKIHGVGTDLLVIEGVTQLYPVEYDVDRDRIVAGTYLFSAVAAGGDITLKDAPTGYMKAAIETAEDSALIGGNKSLRGCHVMAEDLRGGAALVLAGLCATGDTLVSSIEYIERGYEDICRDYRELGADIGRYCEEEKKAE